MLHHVIVITRSHDDIMLWKHFPHYCEGNPPVMGDSPHKGLVACGFDVFCDVHLNKWLNKQWRCQRFQMPWCSYAITVLWMCIIIYITYFNEIKTTHSMKSSKVPALSTTLVLFKLKVWLYGKYFHGSFNLCEISELTSCPYVWHMIHNVWHMYCTFVIAFTYP